MDLVLASRDETFEKFLAFLKKTEKRVGHSLVCLRSDHGTEFENLSFIDYCMSMVLIIIFQLQEHPSRTGW